MLSDSMPVRLGAFVMLNNAEERLEKHCDVVGVVVMVGCGHSSPGKHELKRHDWLVPMGRPWSCRQVSVVTQEVVLSDEVASK